MIKWLNLENFYLENRILNNIYINKFQFNFNFYDINSI